MNAIANHPPPSPLRIGLLGAARIAANALLKPARLVAGVQVTAVAARDPRRARALADAYQIPTVYATYQALIDDPTLDAIYNPLPNSLHAEWSIKALRAGKHVLCEKPLANNAAEARQMAQVADECGRLLIEAFHIRYHPLLLRMKEIVASGELGAIRHLEAHFCIPLRRWRDIRYQYELGGGAMMDLGCYTTQIIRYLAGAEPAVVWADARLLRPQIDRYMAADLRFADGRTAHMTCSLLSLILLRISAKVVGDQGELQVINPILPQLYHRLRVKSAQGHRVEHFPGDTTYTYQLRAFARAVRGELIMPTDGWDGVKNMQVIDEVYRQAGLLPRGTASRQ